MTRKISASILNADLLHLAEEVSRVRDAGADMLHFDVMDGLFVPNISFGLPVLQAVGKDTDLFLDVHLMIDDPLRYVREFADAGADMITFHLESRSDPMQTIQAIHDLGCKAGISIKPGTPVDALKPFVDHVENLLVMTVEPGFGGQSYIHEMNDKIRTLRHWIGGREIYLQVDGGVNADTIGEAAGAGADLIVAGSYLFRAPDMAAAVRALRDAEGAAI